MKTGNEWADEIVWGAPDFFGSFPNAVRAIQRDALLWAADQIVSDGNPEVAKIKILTEVEHLHLKSIPPPVER